MRSNALVEGVQFDRDHDELHNDINDSSRKSNKPVFCKSTMIIIAHSAEMADDMHRNTKIMIATTKHLNYFALTLHALYLLYSNTYLTYKNTKAFLERKKRTKSNIHL